MRIDRIPVAFLDVFTARKRRLAADLKLARPRRRHQDVAMLSPLYIEALLADEKADDVVWELWDVGVITDDIAALARQLIANNEISEWPLSTLNRSLS